MTEAVALVIRGNAYASKGDLDRALKDLDESIRLNPQNATTFPDGLPPLQLVPTTHDRKIGAFGLYWQSTASIPCDVHHAIENEAYPFAGQVRRASTVAGYAGSCPVDFGILAR